MHMKTKPKDWIRIAVVRAAAIIAVSSLWGCHAHWYKHGPASLGYVPRKGKLEQPLIDYMHRARPGRLIGIVVSLNTNLTEANKRVLFQSIVATNGLDRMNQQATILEQGL